jgi:arsenite methyltransferase
MGWCITSSEALEDEIFKMKLRIAQTIGTMDGMTVGDMGCGQGVFTAALARIVGEHGRILAIDITDEYLEEFEERLVRQGVKNRVIFIRADGTSLESILSDSIVDM